MSENIGSSAEPEVPVSFGAFSASLRPPKARDVEGRLTGGVSGPGHADEIWLKILRQKHRDEKRSVTSWKMLIDHYRKQPAHPAGMM